jgi:hypothetical protein
MATETEKVLQMGQSLVGKLQWCGGGMTTNWEKKKPSDKSHDLASMVCWMAPLYIAYQAGVADKEALKRYELLVNQMTMKLAKPYDPDVDGSLSEYQTKYVGTQKASHIGAEAYYGRNFWQVVPIVPTPVIAPGDMVYFFRSNYEHAVHYAVCLDSPNVLSLWTEPTKNNHLQICTIQSLMDVIREGFGGTISLMKSKMPWV